VTDGWDPAFFADGAEEFQRPDPTCPVEVALAAIGGRWTTLLLRDLMPGPRSFGELRAGLPSLSPKVLTERLDRLCAQGMVERQVHRGFPTTTTYSLTVAGRRLQPLLNELYRTGQDLQRILTD
jgi:DNA-binding HxlR family transcriptional regulator